MIAKRLRDSFRRSALSRSLRPRSPCRSRRSGPEPGVTQSGDVEFRAIFSLVTVFRATCSPLPSGKHLPRIASLVFYFKRPWLGALTGWVDLLMILIGVVPRNSTSLNSFFHQFMFDLIFWVAANGGLAANLALNRGKRGPNDDIVIQTTQSPHL